MLGVAAVALAATDPERLQRITHFTDPFKDYTDAGWQPAHGLYALSSGGWFGQGIGASTQKWGDLPEAHTDYIFAVLGEELGLVGTLLVVGLFFTIAYAAIRVALNTEDPFVRYATFGIVVWLLGQMMINVGMVLAVLPVIGIPLPDRVLRRVGPAALARRPRAGDRLRAPRAGGRCRARRTPPQPLRRTLRGSRSLDLPSMRVLLAGGGSAGHTSPLLATADALRRLDPATEITCLGTREGLESRLVPEAGLPLEIVPRVPLPRRPGPDLLRTPTRLRAARAAALEVVDRVRPDVVVGFGGYVSVPAYLAARKRGVPIVVHEGNAIPGIANKLGARMTTHVATSFPDHRPARTRVCTGLPIRRLISTMDRGALRAEALAAFGLRDDLPTLLVTGGSQGAARINAAVSGAAAALAARRACRCCTSSAPSTSSPSRRATCPTSCSTTSTGWTSPTPLPTRCCAAPAATPSPRSPAWACPRSTSRCRSATASRRSTRARSSTPAAACWSPTRALTPEWVAASVPGLLTDRARLDDHGRRGHAE